jgi:hypothetical protein
MGLGGAGFFYLGPGCGNIVSQGQRVAKEQEEEESEQKKKNDHHAPPQTSKMTTPHCFHRRCCHTNAS